MFDFTKHGKTLEGFGWNDRECLTKRSGKVSILEPESEVDGKT